MPQRFSLLRCNRPSDETAGRASLRGCASDWIDRVLSATLDPVRAEMGEERRAAYPASPARAWCHGVLVPGETG
jgi:hypothetical protein